MSHLLLKNDRKPGGDVFYAKGMPAQALTLCAKIGKASKHSTLALSVPCTPLSLQPHSYIWIVDHREVYCPYIHAEAIMKVWYHEIIGQCVFNPLQTASSVKMFNAHWMRIGCIV